MNRYVRKNLVLIVTLCASSLVSLGLLVYAIILTLDWSDNLDATEKAREEVKKLVRSKPAPGRENEARIKQDIALYQEASRGLLSRFKSPLQDAVDAFLNELEPPLLDKLTDEEKEWLVERPETDDEQAETEGTENAENAPEKKSAPPKVRKLTQDDFRRLFISRYEKYKEGKRNTTETISFQTQFLTSFRSIFPAPSWSRAMHKFIETAAPFTVEEIDNSNAFSVLIANMGFPRAIPEQIIKSITQMAGKIDEKAAAGKLNMTDRSVLDTFLYPWQEKNSDAGLQVADYRAILFHWDVLGDIVGRLCASKISTLNGVVVRNAADQNENSGMGMSGSGARYSFDRTVEDEGDYRVFHYTIDVTGSMKSIRAAAAAFDNAYKENRTYIVRAVTLYAVENGAAVLMGQDGEIILNGSSARQRRQPQEQQQSRGRRRRMQMAEPEPDATGSDEEERAEEERRQREAMEAKLPVEQRTGYGEVKIGAGKEFRAVFDLDYIVLKQKQ